MQLKTYRQALDYIYGHIPRGALQMFPGDFGLQRTRYLMRLLGNPQNKLKVIHIAGTSGKGSTAYLLSRLLNEQGFKTGLTVSPHTIDIRERFQINNTLIGKNELVGYVKQLLPIVEAMKNTPYGKPTYFEFIIALAFYIFYDKKVNYAVIETGMGGLYDATNCVRNKRKLAVITSIGLDHTKNLGKTIEKIAKQKCGIIQKNNPVFTVHQRKAAQAVIKDTTRRQESRLQVIQEGLHYKNIQLSPTGTCFAFHSGRLHLPDLFLSLPGQHQVQNASLALAVTSFLSKRDRFELKAEKIRDTFRSSHFIGRLDILTVKGKTLVIDGAHNPDKMRSLISSLKKIFPGREFNFLIAFKKAKNYAQMVKIIFPLSRSITVSSFFQHSQDLIHLSQDPRNIQKELIKLGYTKSVIKDKISDAFLSFFKSEQDMLVVTGSLYLVSEVYHLLKKEYGIKI